MENKKTINIKKQTIRLEENFNKELKIELIKEGISCQQLIENFLREWVEEKRGIKYE